MQKIVDLEQATFCAVFTLNLYATKLCVSERADQVQSRSSSLRLYFKRRNHAKTVHPNNGEHDFVKLFTVVLGFLRDFYAQTQYFESFLFLSSFSI